MKGVTVGEKAIVAAGSVVVKSIPGDEIWDGNSAKFMKTIIFKNLKIEGLNFEE